MNGIKVYFFLSVNANEPDNLSQSQLLVIKNGLLSDIRCKCSFILSVIVGLSIMVMKCERYQSANVQVGWSQSNSRLTIEPCYPSRQKFTAVVMVSVNIESPRTTLSARIYISSDKSYRVAHKSRNTHTQIHMSYVQEKSRLG